jgi:hypothetical protein
VTSSSDMQAVAEEAILDCFQDAHEAEHGYDVDVTCTGCHRPAVVRFFDGEPADESAMACPCGGEMEIV